MKTDPGYDLIIRLLETANVLVKESHRLFRPHGLTEAQFNVLNVLGPAPDGLSQRELSELLVVDRSNVTGLLDRMEKAGWVRRTDHPEDRRVYLVTLTAIGRQLWQKVLPIYMAEVKKVTSVVSEADMKRAMETLRRLDESARKWGQTYEG